MDRPAQAFRAGPGRPLDRVDQAVLPSLSGRLAPELPAIPAGLEHRPGPSHLCCPTHLGAPAVPACRRCPGCHERPEGLARLARLEVPRVLWPHQLHFCQMFPFRLLCLAVRQYQALRKALLGPVNHLFPLHLSIPKGLAVRVVQCGQVVPADRQLCREHPASLAVLVVRWSLALREAQ